MDRDYKGRFRFAIGSQYFLYFGVMGIFLPYFNLYCFHLGFNGFQIGVLSALRTVATILFALLWATLADRFQVRKSIYILCNFISAAIWVFYFYTTDFGGMLVITVFYGIFYAPLISFLEALTIDILGKRRKDYGRIRVWGSIAFIMTVILLGKIIDLYSIEIILAFIFAGSLLQAFISAKIPDIAVAKKESFIPGTKIFTEKRAVIFLFCAFLMLVSHGTYYGFFSIHLAGLGYSGTFIGIAWAVASIAEIFVMIKSDRIFRRFSLENVLVFSFMVAASRWFMLFFAVSPAIILLSQIFHAASYGTFHIASILYIDSLTPNKSKTLGQTVNNVVTYGLGMTTGLIINGYLYETTGSFTLFFLSGIVALIGALILKGFQWFKPPTP